MSVQSFSFDPSFDGIALLRDRAMFTVFVHIGLHYTGTSADQPHAALTSRFFVLSH